MEALGAWAHHFLKHLEPWVLVVSRQNVLLEAQDHCFGGTWSLGSPLFEALGALDAGSLKAERCSESLLWRHLELGVATSVTSSAVRTNHSRMAHVCTHMQPQTQTYARARTHSTWRAKCLGESILWIKSMHCV